jgi:RNA-dependent RNA polymerase
MSILTSINHRSNRVLRLFSESQDSFLRVSFTDESRLQFRFLREHDKIAFLNARVGTCLKRGLRVTGRDWEFLGYSNSALSSHTVYFVCPFEKDGRILDAEAIRGMLGDFKKEEHYPARYLRFLIPGLGRELLKRSALQIPRSY